MHNIIVTGKNSFIGNAFARRASLFPDKYSVEKLSLRAGGASDANFAGADCVLHVAGLAHVRYSDARAGEYMAINRDLAVETAARAKAAGVRQFVLLSSMIVYGKPARAGRAFVVTPDTPENPENAYGQSKLEAERGVKALADGNFTVTVIRPPTVYGAGCRGNYSTVSRFARYLPLIPAAGGEKSMIYVENLAEFIRLIIDDCAGGTFYPQDARRLTTPELVEAVRAAHGKSTKRLRIFDPILNLMGGMSVLRRIFGGMAYDMSMSDYPRQYRLFSPNDAINRTEEGNRG